MLNCSFFCVQPLHIEANLLLHLYSVDKPAGSRIVENAEANANIPIWKKKADAHSNTFAAIFAVSSLEIDIKSFATEIKAEYNPANRFLADSVKKISSTLMYDNNLVQFYIIYKIDLEFVPTDILRFHEHGVKNLYTVVKEQFSKDSSNCKLPIIIDNSRNYYIDKATSLLNKIYNIVTLHSEVVSILDNTINITNVVNINNDSISKSKRRFYSKQFLILNKNAESINRRNNKGFLLNNISSKIEESCEEDFFYFSGRFHTIFIDEKLDMCQYIAMQVHIQTVWFHLHHSLETIVGDNFGKTGQLLTPPVLRRIDYVKNHNDRFRLLADSELFNHIQKKWNIDDGVEYIAKLVEKEMGVNEMARLQRELYTDSLTHLHSRKWFDEKIIDKSKRFVCSGLLCVIDLDKFKAINDTYGHDVGDDVLKYIANQLKGIGEDVVRFGGDEFLIIFKDCDKEQANESIGLLKHRIIDKMFIVSDSEKIHPSFSYGFCDFVYGQELSDVFCLADKAMYLNKKAS